MSLTPSRPACCLITGASGFIGSRLAARFAGAVGQAHVCMVRSEASAVALRGRGQRAVVADLLRPAQVQQALAGCDAVVHLAHGDRGPEATRVLVQAAAAARVRRFVHISSMSVHGPVPGPEAAFEDTARIGRYDHDYSDSKAEQEEIVQAAIDRGDLAAVILRPTVVYGPGSHFVRQVVEQARAGELTMFDGGCGVCNALHVDDLCAAIDAALTRDEALGQAMFINADQPVSWGTFIGAFAALVSPAPRVVDLSSAEAMRYWAAQAPQAHPGLVSRVVRKLKSLGGWQPAPAPWPPAGRVMRETFPIAFANGKARRLLAWAPAVSFEQGVASCVPWLQAEGLVAR
ncbi:MAG: NAD-dependent epimerase/dehydratase family protein [Burkholderiales bacterium]|nr:MAG: NAD-dependent epimerase/dehydratase family protein [Burkholderiales bacterium]